MSVLTRTADIAISGYPIAGTNEQPEWQPESHNEPRGVADYREQARTPIPKVFGACELIFVSPALIQLQLF
jgi:hypothetical protein